MRLTMLSRFLLLASLGASLNAQQLPDGPGKATVQRVCGTCHPIAIVLGKGLTRDQWHRNVMDMIERGAKLKDAEVTEVVDYLAAKLPPGRAPAPSAAGAPPGRRPGGGMGGGSADKHIVDIASADRGKTIYIAECITCHGPKARGASDNAPANQKGSDLVRSVTVLHDRYGSTIGPFLLKGHPMQSGKSSAKFTTPQIEDISNYLHQRVGDTLRSGPYSEVINVLTGDPRAGAAYFKGEGKCTTCHSANGDLAGIAKKYDPPTLQQRMLFPRLMASGRRAVPAPTRPVLVTVTPASGPAVTGVLDKLDDFDVSLRDGAGEYRSWKRTPDLKVEKKDPYAAHIELLDQYSDKNIHDLLAYLETLR